MRDHRIQTEPSFEALINSTAENATKYRVERPNIEMEFFTANTST